LFWSLLINGAILIYFLTFCVLIFRTLPARRRYLASQLPGGCADNFPPAAFEYRSRLGLFGLPLVHVRIGDRFDVLRGPVKAWIAIGSNHAVGVLFASGVIAVAPVSLGGIAIGLLPFGALAFGVLAIGAGSVGVWAFGGLAIGWQAYGGCAIAWNAAVGGVTVAREFALGGIAHASQANNDVAGQFIRQNLFFQCAHAVSKHGIWLLLIWVIPATLQARIVAHARRRREQKNS
jgi:hypothetical protein